LESIVSGPQGSQHNGTVILSGVLNKSVILSEVWRARRAKRSRRTPQKLALGRLSDNFQQLPFQRIPYTAR
jgi:predicted lysophospholipase L1 biosynthesis ABC-type transport system permease subunit